MARSKLNVIDEDLISDSGSVLWSIVKGEQLEYPVTIQFIQNALSGYAYEAVVVEGLNTTTQTEPPKDIRPAGVQTTLTVRLPTYRGNWDAPQAYNSDDIVLYQGQYYAKVREASEAVIDSTPPSSSSKWSVTTLNRVFLQFPSTLGSTWSVQPTVDVPVYGFFELRVTETMTTAFKRTWKPIRGMVEIQFSPTAIVPDLP